MALIKLGQGDYADYSALATKDQYTVYFTTDTHQIFVGSSEYTKGTKTLNAVPTEATAGDQDRLYFYNNELFLCEGSNGSGGYTWVRVANINDTAGTVTSVTAGEGLETADGQPITNAGTIKHSIPSGAAATADPIVAQTPDFGETFNVQGIGTDKFGHVTSAVTHTVTMPTETPVTVTDATATAVTLQPGDSFTVVTGVGMSTAAGSTDHDVVDTATTFTLPSDVNTTYSISSDTEGVVTLTGSDSSSSTALINGWNDLAKKSDITAVFKYKGTVATVADLPTEAEVGDVYNVTTGTGTHSSTEYVCVTAGTGASSPAQYEELGPVVDLSAYATTAYVDEKLTWIEF